MADDPKTLGLRSGEVSGPGPEPMIEGYGGAAEAYSPDTPVADRAEIWPLPDAFGGPHKVRMGVKRLAPAHWLDVDRSYPAQIAHKEQLFCDRYDDVVVSAHARDAERELLDTVRSALIFQAPELSVHAAQIASTFPDRDPIANCGALTQEDWLLLDGHEPDLPVIAGAVCFPTRWLLAPKLGLSVTGVHDPVHEYDEDIAGRVLAFMHRLRPGEPWLRTNWNIVDDAALYQPDAPFDGPGPNPAVTAENAGETLWLRVERETFLRLPKCSAIAFGIRVHQRTLASLRAETSRLARLVQSVRELPVTTAQYKGTSAFIDQLGEWSARQRPRGGPRDH